jgi:hypothetical protein
MALLVDFYTSLIQSLTGVPCCQAHGFPEVIERTGD